MVIKLHYSRVEQLSARVMQKLVTCDETPIILSFKTVLVAKLTQNTRDL